VLADQMEFRGRSFRYGREILRSASYELSGCGKDATSWILGAAILLSVELVLLCAVGKTSMLL
jgi:hypothetical protein